jgi:biopolymer transport protein ExbD
MGLSVDADAGTGGFNPEPNVVPMIDILLVLLIIFMMQVAVSRRTMDVQLPPKQEVEANPNESTQSNQIVLELGEVDGTYSINSELLQLSELDNKLHEIYDTRPAKLLFIKTAGNRPYGEVVTVMDIARGAGVQVIGFTPPELKAEE